MIIYEQGAVDGAKEWGKDTIYASITDSATVALIESKLVWRRPLSDEVDHICIVVTDTKHRKARAYVQATKSARGQL